jgi:O-antigen ligase
MSEQQLIIEKKSLLFYLTCMFIIATSILGGANENDWLANVILLYLAAPLLSISIYGLMRLEKLPTEASKILPCLCLVLLIPFFQLVPFPEDIWSKLPFHDLAGRALLSAGVNHPSGPLTLAPNLTWISLLSLLPPLSVFLSVLLFSHQEKMAIIRVVLVCGAITAMFGLFQFSLNSNSAFYLYPGSYAGDAVGFFKNRNHFAAQAYALLPLAAVISVNSLNFKLSSSRRGRIITDYFSLFFGISCLFLFIVSCIFARSRTGLILMMIALAWISFLPEWKFENFWRNDSQKSFYSRAYGFFVGFSVLFAMEFGFYRVMERFNVDSLYGFRQQIGHNTLNATLKSLPYGTGLGSFQKIYAATQPIKDVLSHQFVNRAHNDYLELLLETGGAGLFVIIGFLIWYANHIRHCWWGDEKSSYILLISRASCMTIGLLLLHSFVDYPLRTQILMTTFALCCAILVRSDLTTPTSNIDSDEVKSVTKTLHNPNERRRKRIRIQKS